jgi:hypothetical protein
MNDERIEQRRKGATAVVGWFSSAVVGLVAVAVRSR